MFKHGASKISFPAIKIKRKKRGEKKGEKTKTKWKTKEIGKIERYRENRR